MPAYPIKTANGPVNKVWATSKSLIILREVLTYQEGNNKKRGFSYIPATKARHISYDCCRFPLRKALLLLTEREKAKPGEGRRPAGGAQPTKPAAQTQANGKGEAVLTSVINGCPKNTYATRRQHGRWYQNKAFKVLYLLCCNDFVFVFLAWPSSVRSSWSWAVSHTPGIRSASPSDWPCWCLCVWRSNAPSRR